MKASILYIAVCGLAFVALITRNFYLLAVAAVTVVVVNALWPGPELRWLKRTLSGTFKRPR